MRFLPFRKKAPKVEPKPVVPVPEHLTRQRNVMKTMCDEIEKEFEKKLERSREITSET